MEINWSALLTLLSVVLLAACGCGFVGGCRYVERARGRRHCSEEHHLQVLCGSLRELGDRVFAVEADLRRVMERQDQVEMRAPSTEYFKHAIALVRRGASLEDLMAACGLAKGEAELLHLLHHSNAGQAANNGGARHACQRQR